MIEETTGGGRRMSRLRLPVSGIAFALFVAACEDVVTTGGQLIEEEAGALFAGILTLQAAVANELELGAGRADIEVPCPKGGASGVDGFSSMSSLEPVRFFFVEAVIVPTKCKLAIDDQTFAIDGDPFLRVDIRATVWGDNERFTDTIDIEGEMRRNVRWRRGNVSGICMIDVTLDARVDWSDLLAPIVEGGYSGSVCGHEMDVEWDPKWTFYCSGDPGCTEEL